MLQNPSDTGNFQRDNKAFSRWQHHSFDDFPLPVRKYCDPPRWYMCIPFYKTERTENQIPSKIGKSGFGNLRMASARAKLPNNVYLPCFHHQDYPSIRLTTVMKASKKYSCLPLVLLWATHIQTA